MSVQPQQELVVDLINLTPEQRAIWDSAFSTGYQHGYDAGWDASDAQAALVHRRAVEVVHTLAKYPPVDPEERARSIVAQDEMRRRLGWIA